MEKKINFWREEMREKDEKKVAAVKQDRTQGFMILSEVQWKIAFIRDVALGHALNSESLDTQGGITLDGEQGLGLIMEDIRRSLEQAEDLL